jgi:hypothetical protein
VRWFLGFIAVGVGSTLSACIECFPVHGGLFNICADGFRPYLGMASWVVVYLLPVSVAVTLALVLDRPPFIYHGETLCRDCGKILCNLEEARCPSCGHEI